MHRRIKKTLDDQQHKRAGRIVQRNTNKFAREFEWIYRGCSIDLASSLTPGHALDRGGVKVFPTTRVAAFR